MDDYPSWDELNALPNEFGWVMADNTFYWRKDDYVLEWVYYKCIFRVFKHSPRPKDPFHHEGIEAFISLKTGLLELRNWFTTIEHLFFAAEKIQDNPTEELSEDSE